MDCTGNRDRYEELKAHGRAIVLQDPEIWDDEVLRAFGVPEFDSGLGEPPKEEASPKPGTLGVNSVDGGKKNG
jgi:hypothetical protein